MFAPETMSVIVAVVLTLHIVIEIIHYILGFVDNRRTKRILEDVRALLKKTPPCIEHLKRIEENRRGTGGSP